jgi:glutamate-1-semialdehyde 2,1-aminomutase
VLGKIIGGGLPVGAYGAAAAIMRRVAPLGPVYQAGTLSGNPLAMAAGLATLQALSPSVYQQLEEAGAALAAGLAQAAADASVRIRLARAGSLLTVFFDDDARFARFFHAMLDAGVMLPPSQHEAWFISAAHGRGELDATLDAARHAFAALGGSDA